MLLSVLVGAVFLAAAGPAHAQSDPFAPTDPSHPLRLLVNKLNSAEGADLRARWGIDSAIWREPSFAADRHGVLRLIVPAHAEIHAFVPFDYDPGHGDQPQNPAVGSAVRCLIPRHYGEDPFRRWILLGPPGPTNEFTGGNQLDPPLLRRGHLVFLQNSWHQGFDQIPNALLDLGRRANQGARYVLDMLSGADGLGVLPPHRTYAVGSGRAAHVLALAAQLPGVPFDGVLHQNAGSGFVSRAVRATGLLQRLRAVDPAHDFGMAEYFKNVGRKTTITRANGTTRTGTISATLDNDLRSFFGVPAGAQVLYPVVPDYGNYGVEFRFTGQTLDQNVSGPTITTTTPAGLRSLLADVDPSYRDQVDAGVVLLRDWAAAERPLEVRDAMAALDPSGTFHTKLLKVQGTRDAVHYPHLEVEYIKKIIGSGRLRDLRYYFVRGGLTVTQGTQSFVDSTGVVRSLGRELNDLDLLLSWTETGNDPGDLVVADPDDATRRISIQAAHQLHLQWSPLCYLETTEGLPHLSSPCDPRMLFSSTRDGNAEIYSMNPDGTAQTRLTNHPAVDAFPTWSPDHTKIAFTSNRAASFQFDVHVMNADGTNVTPLTTNAKVYGGPAWSPDGTRIAFASQRDGNLEIYVMNADGTGQTRLTNNTASDLDPTWSPDGARIAFVTNRHGGFNFEIYVMNADGTNQTRLTNHGAFDGSPDWSSDGVKIAFTSNRDGNFEIYSMNADGSGPARLTNSPAVEAEPAWTAGDTRIAFTSNRNGLFNADVYVMDADGSGQTRLTNNSALDTSPD